MMRYEWFVCKYSGGDLIATSPRAMTRGEADNLCQLSRLLDKGFTWQVKHRKEVNQ